MVNDFSITDGSNGGAPSDSGGGTVEYFIRRIDGEWIVSNPFNGFNKLNAEFQSGQANDEEEALDYEGSDRHLQLHSWQHASRSGCDHSDFEWRREVNKKNLRGLTDLENAARLNPLMLPRFSYQGLALRADSLLYNPCNDIIFPSIVETTGKISGALGRYYMFYAPHDAPGGICLAFADSLDGPWTEYKANPIIGKIWGGHHDVSHISSPHAIWMESEKCFFLYYHGENDTTRLATTRDGIHFNYEGVVVSTAMYEGISESSYARVFPCLHPEKGRQYVILFMGNNEGTRRIYSAWSHDGRNFSAEKKPLVNPPPGTGVTQVGGPWLLSWQGKNLIIFHGDKTPPDLKKMSTDIYAAEVGADFKEENHLGIFFDRQNVPSDNARVCDPCFVEDQGKLRLFMAIGGRLKQNIGQAIEI